MLYAGVGFQPDNLESGRSAPGPIAVIRTAGPSGLWRAAFWLTRDRNSVYGSPVGPLRHTPPRGRVALPKSLLAQASRSRWALPWEASGSGAPVWTLRRATWRLR